MTLAEAVLMAGFFINTAGLAVTIFKIVWGSGAAQPLQYIKYTERLTELSTEWQAKFDAHIHNVGNVTMNMSERFHQLELAAMEARAVAAETYMRRDSYHKATDEFKRDVRDAHADLKKEMHDGFTKLENQIGAVASQIETNRKTSARQSA